MHGPARSAAAPEPPLLARIDPFTPGSLETRLIYPADTPSGKFKQLKRLLLTPLMQWEARQQVRSFLEKDGVRQLVTAQTLANRLDKHPFRTVSAGDLSAVLAEAALTKVAVPGTLRPLTQAYFRDPDHLAAACRQHLGKLSERDSRALDAFIAFVRDPGASLNRRDGFGIRQLMDKTTRMPLPADLQAVLTDYLQDYLAAYEQAVRTNSGFADGEDGKLLSAFEELYACLPETARPCFEALERFCAKGRIAEEDRMLLQRALPLLAHHYTKLGRESVTQLLPRVMAAEGVLEGKTGVNALQLPAHLTPDEHALAASLLYAVREAGSRYSPTAAIALIEYISLKSHIRSLEADIRRSGNLLAAATRDTSRIFEKQKLAALRKRRSPGKTAKKKLLAYKPVWNASTQTRASKRAELADLQHRLINPESRLRLAFVALYPDRLMQCLLMPSEKGQRFAKQVIQDLTKDLGKFDTANGATANPPAPPAHAV